VAREFLTIDQLKAAIQRRIAANVQRASDRKSYRAPGIYILWELNEDGCNWAATRFYRTGEHGVVIARIIREVQRLYNVRPSDRRSTDALSPCESEFNGEASINHTDSRRSGETRAATM
jgi:hypothetical protein